MDRLQKGIGFVMLFNSMEFLLFFPIVTVIYFLLPKRVRYIWLLICSYYFYMSWGKKQGFLLLSVTFTTYISGRLLDRLKNRYESAEKNLKAKKICLAITIVLNLMLLCYFKYLNYLVEIMNRIFRRWQLGEGISITEIILPVGECVKKSL